MFKKSVISLSVVLLLGSSLDAACPSGTTALGTVDSKEACVLKGKYTNDLVLTSDKLWVLQGGVFVGNDNKDNAILTIQAGTKIIGQSGADFLVITRGSKIMALGRKDAPIVMTSAKKTDRTRGMWGGLIINGNAPINSCRQGSTLVCEAEGEGSTGLYGGNNPEDNSGVLNYVVVEFAGYEITPENELNGIAFQGVGNGTEVDYIQVHMNADDGVEFFGGTVNVKHVVLTGNKDDSLDWTSGWYGKAQFVVIEQYDDQANNGIEGDNLKSPMNATPRSFPTISNLTMIGTTSSAAKGGYGMLLRRGTGLDLSNSIITGFKNGCIDIDDEETFKNANRTMGIKTDNVVVHCDKNFEEEDGDLFKISTWFNSQDNYTLDPAMKKYSSTNSTLLSSGATPFDLFFDDVPFIGAVGSNDWTEGWTTHARK